MRLWLEDPMSFDVPPSEESPDRHHERAEQRGGRGQGGGGGQDGTRQGGRATIPTAVQNRKAVAGKKYLSTDTDMAGADPLGIVGCGYPTSRPRSQTGEQV